jgi:hypothetical protein
MKYAPQYTIDILISPEFVKNTSSFDKFIYLNMVGFILRLSNYVWWRLSEGACGVAGHVPTDWLNAKPQEQSIETYFTFWNPSANQWVNDQIYERLLQHHVTPLKSTLITYSILAMWHGIHFGFYLALISLLLVQSVEYLTKTKFNKSITGIVYYCSGLLITEIFINYSIPSMVIKSFFKSVKVYQTIGFIGHLILIFGVLLCQFHNFKKLVGLVDEQLLGSYNHIIKKQGIIKK